MTLVEKGSANQHHFVHGQEVDDAQRAGLVISSAFRRLHETAVQLCRYLCK